MNGGDAYLIIYFGIPLAVALVKIFTPGDVQEWVERQFAPDPVQELVVREPEVLSDYCRDIKLDEATCRLEIVARPDGFRNAVTRAREERARQPSNQ